MKESRLIYPLELIITGVEFLFKTRCHKEIAREPIRSLLVYQLIKINEMWLPLNRDYKPLGLTGYDNLTIYENYPFLLIPADKVNLNDLREDGCFTPGYYFFDDSSYPDTKKMKMRYLDLINLCFNISWVE